MPFTFCHPAIVLPIYSSKKNWFSLTGLIAGSIVPDFEYFLRLKILSKYSHTLPGMLYFDLPLALIIAFVFHRYVKSKLIKNLPVYFRTRFWRYREFNWISYFRKHWLKVSVSILIGILTHISWDSFTHNTGYFVARIGILNEYISIGSLSIPNYKVAQHLSSIFGFLIIICYISTLKGSKSGTPKQNPYYWPFIAVCTLAITIINWLKMNMPGIGDLIVIGIASALISVIIIPDSFKPKSPPCHER